MLTYGVENKNNDALGVIRIRLVLKDFAQKGII